MSKDSMLETLAFSGEWWLPRAADKPTAGNFSWSGQRAKLTLAQSLTPLTDGPHYGDTSLEYDAVQGVTSEAKLVTIIKAYQSKFSISIGLGGQKVPQTVSSSLVFVGAHVEPETLISEMRVRVPGLELWLGQSGIVAQVIPGDADGTNAFNCFVGAAPELEMPVMGGDLTLKWITSPVVNGENSGHQYTIREVGYLNLKPSSTQTMTWFFEQLEKVFAILALMAGTPMSYDQMKVRIPDWPHITDVLVGRGAVNLCNYESSGDFFLMRPQLNETFPAIVAQWFDAYGRIEEPVQLSLSVLRSKSLWSHIEFLSLMQALEGYHRCISTEVGTMMPETEFKTVKKALYAALPATLTPEQTHAIKLGIKLANQMSLSKRLGELTATLDPEVAALILGPDAAVPRAWVDTRDFYSHWEPELKPKRLGQQELMDASARLRPLLRVLFLTRAGVPADEMKRSLVNGCGESQYLIQLNSREYRARNPSSTAGAYMYTSTRPATDSANEDANDVQA